MCFVKWTVLLAFMKNETDKDDCHCGEQLLSEGELQTEARDQRLGWRHPRTNPRCSKWFYE